MAKKPFERLTKILTGLHTGAEGELSRLERFAHFWALAIRSFVRNRCPVRAAALSYTSLLALIPLLALAISVTSSLLKSEGEEKIYGAIDRFVSDIIPPAGLSTNVAVAPNPSPGAPLAATLTNPVSALVPTNALAGTNVTVIVATGGEDRVASAQMEAARSIRNFIQKTRSGALGVAGTVLLIFVVFALLGRIEETMNDVWGVTRSRNWLTRFEHYWFATGLVPTLVVAGLILASGPRFAAVRHFVESMPLISWVIFKIFPLVLLWVAFAAFYKIMPNTRVSYDAALVGGIIGGTLWYLNNVFGFLYVSRIFSNSKIYGSLGLVPVFMIGLYFSWLILLFGAQVAYAFQNRSVYLQDQLAENVNQRGREFIALRLMTGIGQRFQRGLPAATIQELSTELGIPSRLAQQILQTLLAARLVAEVGGAEAAYVPARPLEAINAHQILHAMRTGGGQELLMRDEPERADVYGEFARIEAAERHAAASVTMLALVNRTRAQLELAPPAGTEPLSVPPSISALSQDEGPAAPKVPSVEMKIDEPPVVTDETPPEPKVLRPEVKPRPAASLEEKRPPIIPDEDRDFPL